MRVDIKADENENGYENVEKKLQQLNCDVDANMKRNGKQVDMCEKSFR